MNLIIKNDQATFSLQPDLVRVIVSNSIGYNIFCLCVSVASRQLSTVVGLGLGFSIAQQFRFGTLAFFAACVPQKLFSEREGERVGKRN